MSAALASAAPTPPPDPDRAGKPACGPRRFAGFLRSLIDCGKQLALTVRPRAQRPDFRRFILPFGTNCLPDILRRIDTAIRRALLLEERALQQLGLLAPPRVPDRAASTGHARTARRSDASSALPEPKRTQPSTDPHHAGWPSIKQFAAEISRRPVAAVLADICRTLGITQGHPLWPAMCEAITVHGGSVADLEPEAGERWCCQRWLAIPFTEPPVHTLVFWPAPWSDPVTAAAATGPP